MQEITFLNETAFFVVSLFVSIIFLSVPINEYRLHGATTLFFVSVGVVLHWIQDVFSGAWWSFFRHQLAMGGDPYWMRDHWLTVAMLALGVLAGTLHIRETTKRAFGEWPWITVLSLAFGAGWLVQVWPWSLPPS